MPASPPPPHDRLREALARVPTPVTVITTHDGDGPHGTTVSAFSSLSADPPLVLVALDRESNLLRKLRGGAGAFGVSVLAGGQHAIALRCASKDPAKFDAVPWQDEAGVPRIEGAACWFRCQTHEVLPGGDHEIVVGRVVACDLTERAPLVYHRRAFHLPAVPPPEDGL